jgi:hypothetical protein
LFHEFCRLCLFSTLALLDIATFSCFNHRIFTVRNLQPLGLLLENKLLCTRFATFTSHFFVYKHSLTKTCAYHDPPIFFKLLVKLPFMMGVRPQLIVVSGLSVGIPLTVGFRPQLVVSGLSVGIPWTVGFRLSQSLWLSRSPFTNFFSHDRTLAITEPFRERFIFNEGILAITKPFHELFFFTMEFWLSRSLFMNFSFSRWNSGYHEAFSRTVFYNGILAITKPFHKSRWNSSY